MVLVLVLMVLMSCKIQNLKLDTNFLKVNHLFSSITDFNRSLLGFSWGGDADGGGADAVDILQLIPYFFVFIYFLFLTFPYFLVQNLTILT